VTGLVKEWVYMHSDVTLEQRSSVMTAAVKEFLSCCGKGLLIFMILNFLN